MFDRITGRVSEVTYKPIIIKYYSNNINNDVFDVSHNLGVSSSTDSPKIVPGPNEQIVEAS